MDRNTFLGAFLMGCFIHSSWEKLNAITYVDLEQFVEETGYVTDTERYACSIVSSDVFYYSAIEGASWQKPEGHNPPGSKDLTVTRVSYNDAMAYCEWSATKPSGYDQYRELANSDKRTFVTENRMPISPIYQVNFVGNVGEIISTKRGEEVRLAEGSLFCSLTSG
jgi:hypothetical protein